MPLYDENYYDGPPSLPMGLYKVPTVCGDDEKEALSYDVVLLLQEADTVAGGAGAPVTAVGVSASANW